MLVYFISAYYSEKAHKEVAPRKSAYWESYMFVWAVKTGKFHSPFTISFRSGPVKIYQNNIERARRAFGQFISSTLSMREVPEHTLLVPVPSKDAVEAYKGAYRSLQMLIDAMRDKKPGIVYDGLRWTKGLQRAHEGGAQRSKEYLKQYLVAKGEVKGKSIVLIDDVLTTGGSLLAAKEVLEEAGANVLFAITCGKTVYDFKLKPFKRQSVELLGELHDYNSNAAE